MNAIDIIILIPFLYGLYSGYTKGLIAQLTGLIALTLALFLSFKLSAYVVEFLLQNNLVNTGWSGIIGFSITFLGIVIAVKIVGMLLQKTTRFIGLGFIERMAGAVLGAVKSVLLLTFLLFYFLKINSFIEIVPQSLFTESQLYPYFNLIINYLNEWWNSFDAKESNITFS